MIRNSYILIFLLLTPLFGFSQKRKDKWAPLFIKAQEQLESKQYKAAIDTYREVMEKAPPKSAACAKATYNIGYVYLMQKNDSAAKTIFEKILVSKVNDLDRGGRGGGIMDEPYALYKHYSCRFLAEIALRAQEYPAALKYISLLEKYPYRHFCGNEYNAYTHYVAEMEAKAHLGLADTVRALDRLIPLVFDNRLSSNKEIVAMCVTILRANYDRTFLLQEFDRGIEAMQLKSERIEFLDKDYLLPFLGRTASIRVFSFRKSNEEGVPEAGLLERLLKQSDFYMTLSK